MPKEPNLVVFQCEFCQVQLSADARMGSHLIPAMRKLAIEPKGTCRACGGDLWTITVAYAETSIDLEESALGLALGGPFGAGFVQTSTSVNQMDYRHVNAAVVAKLNEEPQERLQRVGAFATMMERAKFKLAGARECGACQTLFMRTDGKTWTDKGYCSKLCMAKAEGPAALAALRKPAAPEPRVSMIRVQCAAGHEFDVPWSFAGLTRKCPECGAMSKVPSLDD